MKDLSDGCGGKFDAVIVTSKFEGKPLLARHRMVNAVLVSGTFMNDVTQLGRWD